MVTYDKYFLPSQDFILVFKFFSLYIGSLSNPFFNAIVEFAPDFIMFF